MSGSLDITTPEGKAAFALATHARRGLPSSWLNWDRETEARPISEFEIAELILTARDGMAIRFLRDWAEKGCDVAPAETFKAGAAEMVRILESGFNAEHAAWWYLPALWPTQHEQMRHTLLLMDFADQIDQMKQRTLYIVPASVSLCLEIVLGKDWRKRFKAFLASAKAGAAATSRRRKATQP